MFFLIAYKKLTDNYFDIKCLFLFLAVDITERCEKYLVLNQCVGQRYVEYFGNNMNKF